ncbi:unnamed protein product [Echinostoma caproni]|uniref:Uncharacterized protein n=1 Tax=Echinostoma caproni TaxID=27848 RepID=A0A183B7K2_9TREM|nr:unnamed protein product [Echinostoma caproni]
MHKPRQRLPLLEDRNSGYPCSTPTLLDECEIDEKTREVLLQNIRHRLTPQAMKIRANFEVSCFTYEGIDAVRRALKAGLELTTEELPIRINLIAPPLYVLTAQTMEWSDGVEHLNRVLDTIKQSIESQGGTFKIEQAKGLRGRHHTSVLISVYDEM